MNLKSKLLFVVILSIILIISNGCSIRDAKIFKESPQNLHHKVDPICRKTDASHFVVNNQKVNFKRKDGIIIKLKNFKTILPNGYYFCSLQVKDSLILE